MRFETNDIVIEVGLVDGGASCLLIYPNPIKRNVRAVWQGAPADCKQAGRGLRIDFTDAAPKLELQQLAGQASPADDKAVFLFLEAQAAYLAGNIKLEAI